MLCDTISTVRSAHEGLSYSKSTPGKPVISPRRALAYMPFLSVFSQCSRGVATCIKKTLPPAPADWRIVSFAACRESSSASKGAVMTAAPARASSAATNAALSALSWVFPSSNRVSSEFRYKEEGRNGTHQGARKHYGLLVH